MLLSLLWLAVPAYLIMQVIVLWRSSGRARLAASVPLVFMVPVFAHAIWGLTQNSNLWPLLLLFASPVALLYVCIAALVSRRSNPPTIRGQGLASGDARH